MASDKFLKGTKAEPGTDWDKSTIFNYTTNSGTNSVIPDGDQVQVTVEAAALLTNLAGTNSPASEFSGPSAEPFPVQQEKKRLRESLSEKPPTNPKSNLADNSENVDTE